MNTVRPASPEDMDQILGLQSALPLLPQWTPVAWEKMLTQDPSAGGTHLVSVVERGGVLAGYIASNLVAGESELEALAVAADHRRQGLGRALCRAWMAEAEALRAALLFLEVRPSNQPAIALYRSLGFATSGSRPAYYTAPVEDAMLMRRPVVAA